MEKDLVECYLPLDKDDFDKILNWISTSPEYVVHPNYKQSKYARIFMRKNSNLPGGFEIGLGVVRRNISIYGTNKRIDEIKEEIIENTGIELKLKCP